MLNQFQEGLQRQKLFAQYDKRAAKYQFRPRPLSIYNAHNEMEWRELSGLGQIYSYTVVPSPTENQILAVIQLDEDIRIFAPLKNISTEYIEAGMKVKVSWPNDATNGPPFSFEPIDEKR